MADKPKTRMTLAEHDALLKATGQYESMVERNRQREEERQRLAAEWRRAEQPLVEELRESGFQINSVWEFVNTSESRDDALPILVDHLFRPYPAAVREGIARALAVPEARFAFSALKQLYLDEQEKRVKDGLALAIAAVA